MLALVASACGSGAEEQQEPAPAFGSAFDEEEQQEPAPAFGALLDESAGIPDRPEINDVVPSVEERTAVVSWESAGDGGSPICGAQAKVTQLVKVGDVEEENESLVTTAGICATAVSAGVSHTCAVTVDGEVWCWGYNATGLIGNGATLRPVSEPEKVTAMDVPQLEVAADAAIEDGYNVTGIAAGYSHTCVVTADGGVWCWGDNVDGQVGNGTMSDDPVLVPEKVTALDGYNVTGITAGGVGHLAFGHTCAVTEDGGVWCWGYNVDGQVGNGTTSDNPVLVPEKVTALDGYNVTGITAGGHHTCAVTAARDAWCWGRNSDGQIGYGITEPVLSVERVEGWHWLGESEGAVVVSGLEYGEYTVQVRVSNAVGWSEWVGF